MLSTLDPHSSVAAALQPYQQRRDAAMQSRLLARAAAFHTYCLHVLQVYDLTARTARYKHEYPLPKLVVLGILAGGQHRQRLTLRA